APLSLWREFAISQGWVAGYIQLAMSVRLDESPPGSQLVAHNSCFIVDLRHWDSAKLESKYITKKIKLAARRGAQITDDKEALTENLKYLYSPAMQSRRAAKIFAAETVEEWTRAPSLIVGAVIENEIVAVDLFLLAGKTAEWHIGVA